jgi:hypothetical protein
MFFSLFPLLQLFQFLSLSIFLAQAAFLIFFAIAAGTGIIAPNLLPFNNCLFTY